MKTSFIHGLFIYLILSVGLFPGAIRSWSQENPSDQTERMRQQACDELAPLRDMAPEELSSEELTRRGELWIACEQDYTKALSDSEEALQRLEEESGRGRRLLAEEMTPEEKRLYKRALLLGGESAQKAGDAATVVSRFTEYLSIDSSNLKVMWDTMAALMYQKNWDFDGIRLSNESKPDILEYTDILTSHTNIYENYLARARFYRYSPSRRNPTKAKEDYDSARSDLRTPLVVFVEEADFLSEDWNTSSDKYSQAVGIYTAALERMRNLRNAPTPTLSSVLGPPIPPVEIEDSFPPEWRLRMAQLMKAAGTGCEDYESHDRCTEPGMESCYRCQLDKAIETIDKLQAQTLPSAKLYALRSMAAIEMDQHVRSNADAIRAWKIFEKNRTGQNPTTIPDSDDILHTILGSDHLVFRAPSVYQ